LIYHNGLTGPVEGSGFTPEVIHDCRATNDSPVVDDQSVGLYSIMEVMDINEHEE